MSDQVAGSRRRPRWWWRWALLAVGVAFLPGSVWLFSVVRAQGGQPAGWAAAFLAVTGLVIGLAQVLLGGLALRLAVRTGTALAAGTAQQQLRGQDSSAARPAPAVPRQLPAAVAGFAGRVAELAALTSLLDHSAGTGGTVVISAVDGMAGIGKTALAVCWAHRVAGRFPDGQLYVNLRGFDPAGPPMTPAEAVRGFLDAFQVPPERIPIGLDAQASLYRSILAGRRVLVLLDNARDAAQVRPLLPGSPGCFVLVTSRTRLTSLIAAEGARPVSVDLLVDAEARELLTRRLGPGRIVAEPEAVEEIISLCARLPLALSVVAARAAIHPGFSLAALARELRRTRGRLQAFEGGEVSDDVRAVFSWSYQDLDSAAARLFRLLGLHPGPDITAAAAASLAGMDLAQARRALAELARCHLVDEQVPGRFGLHDLLRAYAIELVGTHDSDDQRRVARQRMLDHCLHTAHAANLLLRPRWEPITLTAPVPGVVPQELTDPTAALAWFEAEHAVLLAAVQLAAATGFPRHAWQLPNTLGEFFLRHGHWADCAATERTALRTAHRYGDRTGQAHAHHGLGCALPWLGRYDEAHDHFRQAIDLFADLGDPVGQANSYLHLGGVFEQQGNPADALANAQRALDLFRAAGSPVGLGRALNSIGWYHALLGQPKQGLTYCRQALTLNREVGDRYGEASTLDSLGYAHHLLGQYDQAIDYFQQAIPIVREVSERHNLATVLDHLGDARPAGGRDAARDAWQQALNILDQLGVVRAGKGPGYPDADEIAAKLYRLDAPEGRGPEQ